MCEDAKPVLVARNLVRSFGEGEQKVTPVNGVSLELYRGEVTLLMGPAGSGKSTLISILSGLLRPDEGQVLVYPDRDQPWAKQGKDLWQMSEQEREEFRLRYCGFIFQGHNLFPALTARQQLELVLQWGEGAASAHASDRAEEMLKRLDLPNKGHLRPIELSGGQKQLVAVGRALIKKDPVFCFADEPTSALDWRCHGKAVARQLRAFAYERDVCVMMISHDERLKKYADRVLYIEDGILVDQLSQHDDEEEDLPPRKVCGCPPLHAERMG